MIREQVETIDRLQEGALDDATLQLCAMRMPGAVTPDVAPSLHTAMRGLGTHHDPTDCGARTKTPDLLPAMVDNRRPWRAGLTLHVSISFINPC